MTDSPLQADPVFEAVGDGWFLPTDIDGFLKWLANSGVPGATDYERVKAFATYPAAKDIPVSLLAQLAARNLR